MTETNTPEVAITPETTPEATPEANTTGLNLVDIKNAVAVIDHACGEGAYKGWELINQVWAVRHKLTSFIEAVEPPAPVEETTEAPAANDTTPVTATAETVAAPAVAPAVAPVPAPAPAPAGE